MATAAQSLLKNVVSVQKTSYEAARVVADNVHQEKWGASFSENACFEGLVCVNHPL